MAQKTYLPALLKLLRRVCLYITRYEVTILKFIGEANKSKLDAVMIACDALEVVIEAVLPEPK